MPACGKKAYPRVADEADKILSNARAEAQRILDKANAEAVDRIEAARKEADAYRSAGEEALRTAMRDAVLGLKAQLMDRFSADVERLVSKPLHDPEFLKQMILEVGGRVRSDAGLGEEEPLEILLPPTVAGLEELRQDPGELEKGKLTRFVLGLTGEMLRETVTFGVSDEVKSGIRVQAKDGDIVVDLTEAAVAGLLLQHLQPRFRAILEGIVR